MKQRLFREISLGTIAYRRYSRITNGEHGTSLFDVRCALPVKRTFPREAVRDSMPLLFELLADGPDPAIRVVLGYFVFVYIHSYMDGNGRVGRFLMNAMLASRGYPWTVVPVERRNDYMAALEAASVAGDVVPFAEFLDGLVKGNIEGKPGAKVPRR